MYNKISWERQVERVNVNGKIHDSKFLKIKVKNEKFVSLVEQKG